MLYCQVFIPKVEVEYLKLKSNDPATGGYRGQLSFFQFLISFNTFLGWIVLFIFGGIGMVALPADNISQFTNRPKKLEK